MPSQKTGEPLDVGSCDCPGKIIYEQRCDIISFESQGKNYLVLQCKKGNLLLFHSKLFVCLEVF